MQPPFKELMAPLVGLGKEEAETRLVNANGGFSDTPPAGSNSVVA
jgi:hypothetical protein